MLSKRKTRGKAKVKEIGQPALPIWAKILICCMSDEISKLTEENKRLNSLIITQQNQPPKP